MTRYTEDNWNAGARGASRQRGASRGRGSAQTRSTARNAETNRTSAGRRTSSGRQSGRSGSGRGRGRSSSGLGPMLFVFVLLLFLVGGALAMKKTGLLSSLMEKRPGKAETTEEETTKEAFDPDVIKLDLYLDYSGLRKDAELLNLNGMDREKLVRTLKDSYDWGMTVRNTNPYMDSFVMPELSDTLAGGNDGGGSDNSGSEEVVEVKNSLSSVKIRPGKDSFEVPDLLDGYLESFAEEVFRNYASHGEAWIAESESEAESASIAAKESEKAKAKEKSKSGSSAAEESTEESTEKKITADYMLEMPDLSDDIQEYVRQLALVWKMNPKNGELQKYDRDSGEFVFSGSTNGYSLNETETAKRIQDAVKKQEYRGTVDADGQVVEAAGESIRSRYKTIGSYSTKTTSNSVRNKNIRLAAASINGKVLKPGEEFSFNDTVGQRTEEKGYGGAAAYNNGEVVQEIGGGVCQVSTTLYNAVFRAGLTTTYRRSHTFAPSYVTPGMDATVSWPGPDYRFVNNSDHAIGIRASYSDQQVYVSIYGVPILPEGVKWELVSEKVADLPVPAPKIIQPGEGTPSQGSEGSEWQAYKIITDNGKVTKEKDHYTHYVGHTPVQYPEGYVPPEQTTTVQETTAESTAEETAATVEEPAGPGGGGSTPVREEPDGPIAQVGTVSAPREEAPVHTTEAVVDIVDTPQGGAPETEAPRVDIVDAPVGNPDISYGAPGGAPGGDIGYVSGGPGA